jgi:plastocyanin
MTPRSAAVLTAAAALLSTAGCGSAGGGRAPTRPASATAAPAMRTQSVRIAGFEYRPARIVARRGSRVRWTNRDSANHTVSFRRGPGDRGNLDHGEHRAARFSRAGTYRYVCQYHPGMHGTVVVR